MRFPILLLATAVAVAGCAADARPAAADGSVPWVDEKIRDEDVRDRPAAPRSPAPGSKPCKANQLAGSLDRWQRPGNGGETPHGFDAAAGKLIGSVDVRNTSGAECTLRGEVPTTMLADGVQIPMLYVHGINEEGRRRVIAVPAGAHANLRLDWSGPFCEPVRGRLELAVELPDNGGSLRAPVTATETPPCVQGEAVNPNARATLSASGFSEPPQPAVPDDSPLNAVTLTADGPPTAASGATLTWHVTLTNPTDRAIPLDPCPGYLLELFSQGDATNQAVNTAQLYRLNCRPVRDLSPHAAVRFEMRTMVPKGMAAGRSLTATWHLEGPRIAHGPRQVTVYTTTIA